MDRDEALGLLRGEEQGIKEWNRQRAFDGGVPILIADRPFGADLRNAGKDSRWRPDLSHSILAYGRR